MLQSFFSSMSKLQFFVFLLLCFAFVLLVPAKLSKWYNSSTALEYEPWNPDNINNIKEQIATLNKENIQVDIDLKELAKLTENVKSNREYILETVSSNNHNDMYNSLYTPYVPFRDYYDEYLVPNKPPVSDRISNKVRNAMSKYANILLRFETKLNLKSRYGRYNAYRDSMAQDTSQSAISKETAIAAFDEAKSSSLKIFTSLDTSLNSETKFSEKKKLEMKQRQEKLQDDFNKKNFNINQYAVVIGIPFFIVAALLMYWYGLRSTKEGGSKTAPSIDPKDKFAFAINTITVLLLILSLLILGLSKVIAENTLAALLGTIGGYVLNNKNKDSFSTVQAGTTVHSTTSLPANSTNDLPSAPPPPPPVATES